MQPNLIQYIRGAEHIDALDLLDKVIEKKLGENQDSLDLDINLATIVIRDLSESERFPSLSGAIKMSPEFATTLAAIFYLGLKLKETQHKNNLTIVSVPMESNESPISKDTD